MPRQPRFPPEVSGAENLRGLARRSAAKPSLQQRLGATLQNGAALNGRVEPAEAFYVDRAQTRTDGAVMNVSASAVNDISEELAPDQPSWARACVGFTVSTCLIIALPLMLASV